MANRHGSPEEPTQDPDTPTDTSDDLAAQGDTTERLGEGVRVVVLRDMAGQEFGRVQLIDGRVLMSPNAARFLHDTNVFLPERGLVTPRDGEDYLRGLLASFRGYALHAEVEE
jgi:hypothetical protein